MTSLPRARVTSPRPLVYLAGWRTERSAWRIVGALAAVIACLYGGIWLAMWWAWS